MHSWRKALICTVFLGLLSWIGYTQANRLRIEHHLHLADEALRRFDFDKAQEETEACLRLRPKDPNLELRLARTLRRSGRFNEAELHLLKSQELGGISPESILEFALLKAQRGDLVDSQPFLVAALKSDSPDSSLILEALAQGSIEVFHFGSAVTYLNQLLEREPDHAMALVWRGQVWERLNRLEEALRDYRRAIEIKPDFLTARLSLGEMLVRLSRGDEALEQFEYLQERQPDAARVLLGLAQCRRQQGDTEKAEELLNELLDQYPDFREGLVQRAMLRLDANKPVEAERLLRRALKKSPYAREPNFLLARALQLQGKETEEKKCRDRVKEIDESRSGLGRVVALMSKSPNDLDLRCQAALLCLHCDRNIEALQWLQGSLQINPNHKPTHAALADYYEQMGQPELAAPHRQAAGKGQ